MPRGNFKFGEETFGATSPLVSLARILARQAAAEFLTAEAIAAEALSSPPPCDEEQRHAQSED